MQSQGLFQHVKRLPQMIESVLSDAPGVSVCAVSASVRPRPAEDSYMPVFRAAKARRAQRQHCCACLFILSAIRKGISVPPW